MKAITAIICSVVLCLGSMGIFPLQKDYRFDVVSADDSVVTEKRIYRTSVKGQCGSNNNYKWDVVFVLNAYDNGHISIEIQCEKSTNFNCNQIGNIQFDDSMIAPVGDKGFAGVSRFNNNNHIYSNYTTSFSDTNIIYTAVYSDGSSSLGGVTLMSFDLYVKENYLHATQKIYMLGTKIEIPFGDETTDKDTIIAQLQEELNKYKSGNSVTADLEQQLKDLKEENEQLKRTINILTRSKFCDVNGDDIVGIEDAQLVLRYYTETVAGKTNGDPIEIWYTKQNTISG